MELLVLGALRVIGAGCCFDIVVECTCVSEITHRNFFHRKFCKWGRGLADKLISLPKNEEEIRHVTRLFEPVELLGCVGYIDCIHIVWDKCPAGFLSACKGKEKLPTLSFQVCASHTKKNLSVSNSLLVLQMLKKFTRYDPTIRKFVGRISYCQN